MISFFKSLNCNISLASIDILKKKDQCKSSTFTLLHIFLIFIYTYIYINRWNLKEETIVEEVPMWDVIGNIYCLLPSTPITLPSCVYMISRNFRIADSKNCTFLLFIVNVCDGATAEVKFKPELSLRDTYSKALVNFLI